MDLDYNSLLRFLWGQKNQARKLISDQMRACCLLGNDASFAQQRGLQSRQYMTQHPTLGRIQPLGYDKVAV